MCDYSMEMYGSRPAREGELYVTARFPCGTIGFAAPGAARIPVCIQCGAKVVLTDVPAAMQKTLGIGAEVETVFAQRETGLYRDGVRLKDGRFVSLQSMPPGVGAYLPSLIERILEPHSAPDVEKAVESGPAKRARILEPVD